MSKKEKLNILLIETHEAISKALMTCFTESGHQVTLTNTNQKAIELKKSIKFDLILEDIKEKLDSEDRTLDKDSEYNFSNIISQSKPMQDIFETVKRLSNFKTTILISGESGTGKELLARAIHFNSTRGKNKFVAINCGAIPESLIESELFGHKMGSFTDAVRDRIGLFEEANGGTIFLDEIGELPLHLQVKLLRVLQEQSIRPIGDESDRKIDVRILAASHRNLEQSVKEGNFREDLFYRLNVVHIHLPSLRERPEDISVLVKHFIKKHNKKLNTKVLDVDDEVLRCFLQYPWKGNIRELENAIERGLILSEGSKITIEYLPEKIREAYAIQKNHGINLSKSFDDDNLSVKQKVKDLETRLILRALEKTHGNRTHAAKLLEISHRTLLYKLKEYDLGEAFK
ncbi:MAG: sigma-54-dependent Fis family transcriptional regulator [bacterium]|nr:sigma-54-dependent Fis family transcriptional regulator [bacterium]